MFRRRLLVAFVTLAGAAVIQGALAWWTISVASENIQRGRLTGDILSNFIEVSNNKQRLRTWVSQALLDAGAASVERDQLLTELQQRLDQLNRLAEQAERLDPDRSELMVAAHLQRREVIDVLQASIPPLRMTLLNLSTLPDDFNPLLTWNSINQTFDAIDGYDVQILLAQTIQRERLTLQSERLATDQSLQLVRGLAIAMALSIATAATLLALYFSQALRQPLQHLMRGTQALQRGHLHYRIPTRHKKDEFAQIAHSVNLMAVELDQHRQRETDARQQLAALVTARTTELQQALDRLQQVDLRRRRLFAEIGHELRTPTTAIRGEAEITLRGQDKPAEDYKAALQRIVHTSIQLGLVIEDLLGMARSDMDTLVLERRLITVEQPLREAIAQIQPSARLKSIHLATQISGQSWLLGDPQRLQQLFGLLLDNAVSYSKPYSQIDIYAERLAAEAELPAYWQLSIRNRGIPISAEELTQVFQRSFRGAAARLHRPDGSGLGLPIASSLVLAHHGQIQLTSDEQQGTVVTVRLPMTSPTKSLTHAADFNH